MGGGVIVCTHIVIERSQPAVRVHLLVVDGKCLKKKAFGLGSSVQVNQRFTRQRQRFSRKLWIPDRAAEGVQRFGVIIFPHQGDTCDELGVGIADGCFHQGFDFAFDRLEVTGIESLQGSSDSRHGLLNVLKTTFKFIRFRQFSVQFKGCLCFGLRLFQITSLQCNYTFSSQSVRLDSGIVSCSFQ